jgi:cytochrome P450
MTSSHPRLLTIDDLPVFDEWNAPDFGEDLDWVADDLFTRPYQGLLRGTDGSVVVYRNADVRAIGRSGNSTHQTLDTIATYWLETAHEEPSSLVDFFAGTTFSLRGPKHRAHKQLFTRRLTTQSVARYASDVRAAAEAQLALVADGSQIDFLNDFAKPVVAEFWARVLGLTSEEARGLMRVMGRFQDAQLLAPDPQQIAAADSATRTYLGALPAALEREIQAGHHALVTDLKLDHEQSEVATRPPNPCVSFAINMSDGWCTFSSAVAGIMHTLLSDEPSLARVKEDSSLVPSAVMEGLRLHGAALLTQREAAGDFDYDGVAIPSGTALTMLWLFGNRDPAVFEDPNSYKLDRENRNRQTTFGGGLYLCSGKNVVRMLCETAVEVLTRPSVDITLTGDLQWVPASANHEVEAMPVTIRCGTRPM